jgi:nicotinamidase-related amidase
MLLTCQMIVITLLAATAFGLESQSPVLAQGPAPVELSVPDPVSVSLEPSITAFLVIDLLESTCAPNPSCVATVPVVATGLAAARTANALVVYSVHLAPDNNILDDVAPMSKDPVFAAVPGDKFFDSNLDYILRQAGITTLVLTGISSNSGVMYTAAAAIQRGYKVVVASDGISGATDLATSVALWQLLHGPGANPQNVPLQARAVTLSRTDLIEYK